MKMFVAKIFSANAQSFVFLGHCTNLLTESQGNSGPDCCSTQEDSPGRSAVSLRDSVGRWSAMLTKTSIFDRCFLIRLLTFDDFAADFAALVCGGVNGEIPATRHQVGRLRVVQGRRAFDWARGAAGHRNDHPRVLSGCGGAVAMRR